MNRKLASLKFTLTAQAAEVVHSLKEPTVEEIALVMWALLTTWDEVRSKPRTKQDNKTQTRQGKAS